MMRELATYTAGALNAPLPNAHGDALARGSPD